MYVLIMLIKKIRVKLWYSKKFNTFNLILFIASSTTLKVLFPLNEKSRSYFIRYYSDKDEIGECSIKNLEGFAFIVMSILRKSINKKLSKAREFG